MLFKLGVAKAAIFCANAETRITDLLCLLSGVSFIVAGFGGFLAYAPRSNWY